MIPSTRFIVLVLLAVPLFLGGAMVGILAVTGLLYVAFLVAVALLDILLLPRARNIRIHRIVPDRFSLDVAVRVAVEVDNQSFRGVNVWIAERLPPDMVTVDQGERIVLESGTRGVIEYRLIARRRGKYTLSTIDVRVQPLMGLFIKQFRANLPVEVQVFPNLENVKKYELQLRKGLSLEEGLARLRRIGQGSDFESLRLYSAGDDIGRVDWKATAKRAELVVRNYQPERRQNILVAIDVGRATAGEFEGISRLDYFVNATLMMAYVALRQGDWFSLVAFSDRIESYLPPVRNARNIDRVAKALYELQSRLVEADYGAACRFLGLKSRKRSLICLMTDVIDKLASDVMIAYMARFARRHLPLLVTLKNTELEDLVDLSLGETRNLYNKAVAIDFVTARKEALAVMRRYGVGVLDVAPGSLTPELINRYLLIKSTRRL